MIRILIADDHAVVRQGLKQIISTTKDIKVTAEATNGQEVLNRVWKENFDVVMLDISMPGRDGVDVLRQIKAQKPNLPVLVLSMHPEEQYAVRVLKAGASGYLTKETDPEEMIKAIRLAALGRKYVTPALAERLAYDVFEAEDGEQGLEILHAQSMDLVILDMLMPRKDGIETLMDLKVEYPRLGVIAMSGGDGNGPEPYLEIATRYGADRVLPKPFGRHGLMRAVRETIKSTSDS